MQAINMKRLNIVLLLVLGACMLSCNNALEENTNLRGRNGQETAELQETNERDTIEENSIGERRLMNFWTLLIQTIHHPCLPHLHGHCGSSEGGGSGGGSGGSTGGSSGKSSGGGSNGGSSGSYNGGGGGDGNNGGGGGGGNGGSSANGASSGNGDGGTSGAHGGSSKSGFAGTGMNKTTGILMLVAAAAATAALVAAIVGQRRNKEERHSLSGSVDRRMKLFSNVAGSKQGGSRPARVVEMNNASDYQLA